MPRHNPSILSFYNKLSPDKSPVGLIASALAPLPSSPGITFTCSRFKRVQFHIRIPSRFSVIRRACWRSATNRSEYKFTQPLTSHILVDFCDSQGLLNVVRDVNKLIARAPNQALRSHRGTREVIGVEYDNFYCRLIICHCQLGLARKARPKYRI